MVFWNRKRKKLRNFEHFCLAYYKWSVLFTSCHFVYVRIAFPLFLPLPLTVISPTATTGSLRISMCVICSLSCTHRFVKKKCSGISDNETLRPVSTLSHGVIVRQLVYLLCVCITNQISCKQENQNFGWRVGRWVRSCKCDVLVI